MKTCTAIFLTLAALLLLLTTHSRAQATASPQGPTRFTVTVEGKPGSPEVLLLPGLTSGRDVFDAEAALLAPTHRLYRFQLDGFAGQPAGPNADGPILEPVVEQLHQYLVANHLHPYVIGHSMGGLIGLMLARRHPEDLRKLLIVDTLPFYSTLFNPAATVATVEPQAKAMRAAIIASAPEPYAANATRTAGFLVNDPAGKKLVAAESIAADRTVMAETMYEDMITDMRPELSAIQTPATLLYPYDSTMQGPDPTLVDTRYKTDYAGMPHLTFVRIDASRHFIQFDQPALFDKQVQFFLN